MLITDHQPARNTFQITKKLCRLRSLMNTRLSAFDVFFFSPTDCASNTREFHTSLETHTLFRIRIQLKVRPRYESPNRIYLRMSRIRSSIFRSNGTPPFVPLGSIEKNWVFTRPLLDCGVSLNAPIY